jgi:Carboxypeptidase regulatory-like domain
VLGRVVVYRNGVAFFERHATVEDGRLTVHVPRDRVDDFLKSLTVVDPTTGKPLSVSIPRHESDDGPYLTMTLETPEMQHAEVLLTYVTESPAWKPSYRIVVGAPGKVMLEGWAIVDNTTSEDWRGVLVGVGASSALAFRYDLWSVRRVDRDLLAGEERFAIAPPTGVSPYSETGAATEELAGLDVEPATTENHYTIDGVNTTDLGPNHAATAAKIGSVQGVVSDQKTGDKLAGVTVIASGKDGQNTTAITDDKGFYAIAGLPPGSYTFTFYYADLTVARTASVASDKTTPVFVKLESGAAKGEVLAIQGSAPTIDPTSTTQGLTRDKRYLKNIPVPGRTFENALGAAAGSSSDGMGTSYSGSSSTESSGDSSHDAEVATRALARRQADETLKKTVDKLIKDRKDVVIEVHGAPGSESYAAARATATKNKLVDEGVPAARIHVVQKIGPGESAAMHVLATAPQGKGDATAAPPSASSHGSLSDTPVGESHFIADRPMTVRSGSSAMVAMVHRETTGGVVYLYDPLSDRGDQRFAFKAVRLDNPTGDTLEPGPVTVYGDGRFIGEGITEPVPPHAAVVIPFALDKQIVVSRTGAQEDRIAKLMTAERGVVTAELQHRRTTRFSVTSRLTEPTKVYLRHRLEPGWALLDPPANLTKVGDSELFEVDLGPAETVTLTVAEATPVEKTFDLSSDEALGMMKVFIEEPEASPELKSQIAALLATHRGAADLIDKIQTLHDQLAEYRSRSGELHAQLVTLKAVRAGTELMATLRAKLADTTERIQKATIAVVDAQEQLMLSRVKFQNQLADLHLTDVTAKTSQR